MHMQSIQSGQPNNFVLHLMLPAETRHVCLVSDHRYNGKILILVRYVDGKLWRDARRQDFWLNTAGSDKLLSWLGPDNGDKGLYSLPRQDSRTNEGPRWANRPRRDGVPPNIWSKESGHDVISPKLKECSDSGSLGISFLMCCLRACIAGGPSRG